jgi:hypothetical protein
MGKEIIRWFIFSVCVGLVPLAINGVLALLTSRPLDISVMWSPRVLFGGGELLMLSVGLAAAAIGNVVATRGVSAIFAELSVGLSFGMGLVAVSAYAIILTLGEVDLTVPGGAVALISLIPYTVMLVVNAACIFTVQKVDERQ